MQVANRRIEQVTSLLYSTNKCRFIADLVLVGVFFPHVTVFALKSQRIPGAVDDEIEFQSNFNLQVSLV